MTHCMPDILCKDIAFIVSLNYGSRNVSATIIFTSEETVG